MRKKEFCMTRKAEFPIDSLFTDRWSPRSFTGENLPKEVLLSGFEAARWSPSGGNTQPWRFVYSLHGSETWPLFTECLMEGNRGWAKNASGLVIVLSKKDFLSAGGQVSQSSSFSLDAGAAWMSFALQMTKLGWSTHAMAGIDKEKIRRDFEVPENYQVEIMIAVGKRGPAENLPENLRAREMASNRHPLEMILSEGKFKSEWRQGT
jgi:nitroreductase